MKKSVVFTALIALTFLLPVFDAPNVLTALWPAICALVVIVWTRHAALGLGSGVVAGALLIHHESPAGALRAIFSDYIFPSLDGSWHVGAIVFTLILGAFAGLLEKSGGFDTILSRLVSKAKDPQRRLLGSVYVIGLLCFFDGLANSLLTGRIARPLADRTGVSRERLAWVVDSTSSPVACVAFISTWIATQLSLIKEGLEGAPFPVEPYSLYFQSIPANPYCLLTLMLVPLAVFLKYQPRAMSRYLPQEAEPVDAAHTGETSPLRAVVPLVALVVGIFAAFPLLSDPMTNPLSSAGWRDAFSGDAGPYALVAGSLVGSGVRVGDVSKRTESFSERGSLPRRGKSPARTHHPGPGMVAGERVLGTRCRGATGEDALGWFPGGVAATRRVRMRGSDVFRHRFLLGDDGAADAACVACYSGRGRSRRFVVR